MANQAETNNLDYLSDPAFNKLNRLFVLLFKNEEIFFKVLYTKS